MDPFSGRIRLTYFFDSELPPARFWKKLRNYLKERNIKAELSERKWQFNFIVEDELDDEDIKAGVRADSCEIKVHLLQRDLTPAGN